MRAETVDGPFDSHLPDGRADAGTRRRSGLPWAANSVRRVPSRETAVDDDWRRKGATLSDKTARKEFGLTQAKIDAAIEAGQLQCRVGVIHGNPWLRLLRREVEALMETAHDDHVHRQRRAKAELARVDRELKRLRAEVAALEEQRRGVLRALEA